MRKLYNPATQNKIKEAAKRMSVEHNLTLNVIDVDTGKIVQSHTSHNAATNSLLMGIAHYLIGDGVFNQAYSMLSDYVPRYISLGTMGLFTQEEDSRGLPVGLGTDEDVLVTDVNDGRNHDDNGNKIYYGSSPETERLCKYIQQCPGFGADGYDIDLNNNRPYFGLGPKFENRDFEDTISCELVSDTYPRVAISLRDIVPESQSEIPKTIDVIYSGMISVAALKQFRSWTAKKDDKGRDTNLLEQRDYIFITEAGLWARKNWETGGDNGLLAAYRIIPPDRSQWDIGTYVEASDDGTIPAHFDLDPENESRRNQQIKNQETLKRNILRVGKNQVVQVIWKIQLGGLDQLGGISELYPSLQNQLVWHFWDDVVTYEYDTMDKFPKDKNKPASDKIIYIDKSTGKAYVWNGIKYVEIGA